MNSNSIKYRILILLLLYMPFHFYISEIFLSFTQVDNLMRDIVIIVLFLVALIKGFKVTKVGALILFNCAVLVIFAALSILSTRNLSILNVLRTYLVPTLIYFVVTNITLTKKQIEFIHKLVVVELAIIAIYGFFQAFFLGDDFIIALGYPSQGGFLKGSSYYIGGFHGMQRAVGTFVSPNTCGLIIAVALCVVMFSQKNVFGKSKIIWIGMLIIGLLGTLSRSAILGVVIAIVFVYIFSNRMYVVNKKMLYIVAIIGCLGITGVLAVDAFLLNGLFVTMLTSSIGGLLTGSDISASAHFSDLFTPIAVLIENPWGLGFGNNGPMAVEYMQDPNLIESSIYLMIYEIGVFFGLLYFLPYIIPIVQTLLDNSYRYKIPAAVCVTVLLTYVFLPHVQTYEAIFYSFLFVGMYYNSSVIEYYKGAKENG